MESFDWIARYGAVGVLIAIAIMFLGAAVWRAGDKLAEMALQSIATNRKSIITNVIAYLPLAVAIVALIWYSGNAPASRRSVVAACAVAYALGMAQTLYLFWHLRNVLNRLIGLHEIPPTEPAAK